MPSRLQTNEIIVRATLSLIGLNCAFFAAYFIAFSNLLYGGVPAPDANYTLLLVNANLLFLLINWFQTHSAEKVYRNFAFFLMGYLAVIILTRGFELSRLFHVTFLLLLFLSTTFLKYSDFVGLVGKYLLPNLLRQQVILISDVFDISIVDYVDTRPGNYKCIGLLSDCPNPPDFEPLYLGGVDRLEEILNANQIDEVLVSAPSLPVEKINKIVIAAQTFHATASILPPYFQFLANQNHWTADWMGVPIISLYHSQLAIKSQRLVKRALDICISLLFLGAVFPILYLIVAPAIWITTRGPVFFKQLRKGYKQKPFFCYKFRTMKAATGIDEAVQAKRKDSRVTMVGESLRKSSIDEIPQFWNVLLGQMSIVGPRPHMVEHDQLFEKSISKYNVRFVTKPGITGWAQINGLRGSVEGNRELLEKRIEHDLWYIRNWSIWLDLKIIYLTTVKIIIKGDPNAY